MGAGLAVLMAVVLAGAACAGNAAETDALEIEQGRVLYGANGCGTCHGMTGRGDGPIARTLTPPPRDFRDASAFKNGGDPASVAATIATGLTRDGGQMQSYFHLSGRERHLLARYVIALRESPATPPGDQATLVVTGAWVREPVPGRTATAAYAVVENTGPTEIHIVSGSTDAAAAVEFHEMIRAGDMMKMSPVKSVSVPAKGRVELKPGGLHVMLFQLTKPLKTGDTIQLMFTTSTGATVQAAAAVKRGEM